MRRPVTPLTVTACWRVRAGQVFPRAILWRSIALL